MSVNRLADIRHAPSRRAERRAGRQSPPPASVRPHVPTIIIVLQTSRVLRALDVGAGAPELDHLRAEVQAWFDARAWSLEHDGPRLGEPRRQAKVRELPAGAVGSLRWEIRGPADHGCEATGWILPGEARLVDEAAQVRRLPPEQVDAMGVRRALGEATVHRRRRKAG